MIIKVYASEMGVEPFDKWFSGLRSARAKQIILKVLTKFEAGHMGDVKSLGGGVFEHRIFFQKGYRIYFAYDGSEIIILLGGSSKDDQKREIERAKQCWKDYKRRGLCTGGENYA